MATFGNTTAEASHDGGNSNSKIACLFTLSGSALVSKLTVNCDNQRAGHAACNIRGVIYSDSSTSPDALLGAGEDIAIADNAADAWVDLTFASPVSLSAGTYWLGIHFDGDASGVQVSCQTASGNQVWQDGIDAFVGGPSDPYGAHYDETETLSIYATYTVPDISQPGTVSGAALELHAEKASSGTGPGVNDPLTTSWYDTSGNGNHATVSLFAGDTSSGWAGSGVPYDPYRLVSDGGNDVVTVTLTGLDSHDATIEAWIRFTTNPASTDGIFMGSSQTGIAAWGTSGQVAALTWNSTWSDVRVISPAGVLNNGAYHHCVQTLGSQYMKFYVDNAYIGQADILTGFTMGALGAVRMFNRAGGGYWDGDIPIARIHPYEFDAADVQQNYLAGMTWNRFSLTNLCQTRFITRGVILNG